MKDADCVELLQWALPRRRLEAETALAGFPGRVAKLLQPERALAIGRHKRTPEDPRFAAWPDAPCVFRCVGAVARS